MEIKTNDSVKYVFPDWNCLTVISEKDMMSQMK